MKVLIVEDEPGAREGVFRLLRRSFPTWEILPPCRNGILGLESIRAHCPDIILTDIRMSSGDGLEMIKQMRRESDEAAVIILSGYPDFEVARQCLALGVQDYLVKPAAVDEILAAVRRSEANLFSSGDLARQLSGDSGPSNRATGVLYCFRFSSALSPEERRTLKQEVCRISGEQIRVQAAEFPVEAYYYFFSHAAAPPARRLYTQLLDILKHRTARQVVGCAIACEGVSLALAARALNDNLKRFLLFPEPPFFFVNAQADNMTVPVRYQHSLERDFIVAFQERDSMRLASLFDEVCSYYARSSHEPQQAMDALRQYLFFVQNHARELDPPAFAALSDLDPVGRLNAALTFGDVRKAFGAVVRIVSQPIAQDVSFAEDPHVRRALTLIENNLPAPLSLTHVSDKLGISAQHLSRLFRLHCGVGFAQYLVGRRIERSKVLLASPKETIGSVAEKSGFSTQRYFCACFKQVTGFTPSEYRRRFH